MSAAVPDTRAHVTTSDHDETARQTGFIANKSARINTLPTELLAKVFTHCLDKNSPVFGLSDVVCVSHVCEHWREIALSTGVLWSIIKTDYPKWVPVMLERSQGAALWMDLDLNMIKSNTSRMILETVLPELHRAQILRVSPLSSQWYNSHKSKFDVRARQLEDIIFECFRPTLRPGLELAGVSLPDSLFLNEDQRLRRLSLTACAISWDLSCLSSLETLELRDIPNDVTPSYEQLIEFLSHTPNLRHLSLKNALPLIVPGTTVVKLLEYTVSLPHLESLQLEQEAFPIHWLLDHLVVPATAKRILSCTFLSPQIQIDNLLAHLPRPIGGPTVVTRSFWLQVSTGLGAITIGTSTQDQILRSRADADFQITWRVPTDVNEDDDLINQHLNNALQTYFTETLSSVRWLTLSIRRRQLLWPAIFNTCPLRRIVFDRGGAAAMAPAALHFNQETPTLDSLEAQTDVVSEPRQQPQPPFPNLIALDFSRADLANTAPHLVEELCTREDFGLKPPFIRLWRSAGFGDDHVARLKASNPSFEVHNIYSTEILKF